MLKTTTPADINNTSNLSWRYIIRNGWTWRIDNDAPEGYAPQSADERAVLALIGPEHASQK